MRELGLTTEQVAPGAAGDDTEDEDARRLPENADRVPDRLALVCGAERTTLEASTAKGDAPANAFKINAAEPKWLPGKA